MVPQLVQALPAAVTKGLHLPLVYNSSSYDSVTTLKALDGIIDIYLADLRYASDAHAQRFSQAPDYVAVSRAAIKEMYHQVGNLTVDEDGIARRGLVVRHLILPHDLAGSRESLAWLASEISSSVTVSIMSQYHPSHRASKIPLLARPIQPQEYYAVSSIVEELGLENGWIQEMGAEDNYLPNFKREGHPFAVGSS
jgi:putative pyruvate formate lyase activating enzyme